MKTTSIMAHTFTKTIGMSSLTMITAMENTSIFITGVKEAITVGTWTVMINLKWMFLGSKIGTTVVGFRVTTSLVARILRWY